MKLKIEDLKKTMNISVSIRMDQYVWLKDQRKDGLYNVSKRFQHFIDNEMGEGKR